MEIGDQFERIHTIHTFNCRNCFTQIMQLYTLYFKLTLPAKLDAPDEMSVNKLPSFTLK